MPTAANYHSHSDLRPRSGTRFQRLKGSTLVAMVAAATIASECKTPVSSEACTENTAVLVVSPAEAETEVGDGVDFKATCSPVGDDVTEAADWTSLEPEIAKFRAIDLHSRGRATGVSPGNARVRAEFRGFTGEATLTVTAIDLSVAPKGDTIPVGSTIQLAASRTRPDRIEDVTESAEWMSRDRSIATVSNQGSKGLVTGVQPGGVYIVAAYKFATDSAYILVSPNFDQPTAQITSPADGTVFAEGDPIAFAGTGIDLQDGALTGGSLVWYSDRDGQIGTGEAFSRNDLSVSDHVITLTVTDSDGNTDTAMISITVNSSATASAYVTNWSSDNVSVIDLPTNTVTTTIPAGVGPGFLAITPNGNSAYVPNAGSDDVTVIDVATNTVTTTIPVGDAPQAVAFTPNGGTAYVAGGSFGTSSVSVIDVATSTVTTTISSMLDRPRGIAITPDGSTAYVANFGNNEVAVIDVASNTVTTTIPIGNATAPQAVAITPDGTTAYISNDARHDITVIDVPSNTIATTIGGFFNEPRGVAFTPGGTVSYVANTNSDFVTIIDVAQNSVTATLVVGSSPQGVAFTPNGALAYVTNDGSDNVSVIDVGTETVIATIPVGDRPRGVAITP